MVFDLMIQGLLIYNLKLADNAGQLLGSFTCRLCHNKY